jgi:hypothetical protein
MEEGRNAVLFHTTTMEIAFVGCILLDIGRLPLLRGVLRFHTFDVSILKRLGITAGPLLAAIGGRYRRCVTGHCDFLCNFSIAMTQPLCDGFVPLNPTRRAAVRVNREGLLVGCFHDCIDLV